MISHVCVHRGSAGKSRQAAREEDKLRAGCYQQDSSHSYSLSSHTPCCSDTPRVSSLCVVSKSLKVLRELELVLSLLQVWLKMW